mmetsp:Transcript_65602/g.132001  ORF Transcript_65602/g.132001 Transcript_65602/m.132001 type:complete len:336 (-) Transcript_65602:615-1622(-)
MTKSTSGMSRPLEATSVATSSRQLKLLNFPKAALLRRWSSNECRHTASTPSSSKTWVTSWHRLQDPVKMTADRARFRIPVASSASSSESESSPSPPLPLPLPPFLPLPPRAPNADSNADPFPFPFPLPFPPPPSRPPPALRCCSLSRVRSVCTRKLSFTCAGMNKYSRLRVAGVARVVVRSNKRATGFPLPPPPPPPPLNDDDDEASLRKRSMASDMVALKSRVCLFSEGGKHFRTFVSSGANPEERIRSASSSTRKRSRCSGGGLGPSKWSMSLPGVATTTCGRLFRARDWAVMSTPPITHSKRTPMGAPSAETCSPICSASSRVGVKMSANTP